LDRGRERWFNYRTKYSQEDMEQAIEAVRGGLCVKVAAARYHVPRTTLGDRAKCRTRATLGRPTQLSEEEEDILAQRLELMASWGFPLNYRDFRELIKSYLDSAGRRSIFKDNLPTKKFVKGFLNRHPNLAMRKTNNIKRSRASVSREEVLEFFEHFSKTVEGVPASNIWNYDETNFKDDPGSEKSIFKKGTKYAERVMNSTKSAVSVMFCCSAGQCC
jgi:helix-turn-helix, Psq domain